MGLGSEYNNNQGCQCAIARDVASPYLYVRYKEGAAFGTWRSIRTTYSDAAGSLIIGNQSIYGDLYVNGTITGTYLSVANSGTEYLGMQVGFTAQGSSYTYPIRIMYNSFTGYRRSIIDDELFDIENVQQLT